MKVLMLEVNYISAYSEVYSYMLLPLSARGVLFSENYPLNENIESVVDLGEIDGKHSECYGDLKISEIDLDSLNPGQAHNLVKGADSSDFDVFLEQLRYSDDWNEGKKEAFVNLNQALNIEIEGSYLSHYELINAFEELLESKYKETYKSIKIKDSDFDYVVKLLKENNIEIGIV